VPSRPREFHPEPLTDPDLSLSSHPARAIARRLPPSVDKGLLPANRLAQINRDDPPPSLHDHYSRFFTSTRQSAPLRRIGTFGLAVRAACTFSLGIAGQVLTFHTGAWSSFAPPTRRMPLGWYQDILRADPGGWVSPRFRHRLISFRRFRSGSLALASLDHTCRDHCPDFSTTLATTAFDRSSLWRLGISDLIAEPEGPSFISSIVAQRRLDRRYS
jgi:hypothetical protein